MFRNCLLSFVLATAGAAASADTLLIDGLDMAAQSADQRPSRGQSMASVEARFGEPSSRVSAIGDPPISRWEYPGFTVFFEYEHVIHAVVDR
jgi:hypothetical protein